MMNRLKRLLRRKRKNSGFTLVELVVSCGLLGILVVGVTAFIAPVLRSAAENEKNVRATLLAQTINDYISRSLRDAYDVVVFENASRADTAQDGAIANQECLKKMKAFVDSKSSKFELKCFSYSWAEDKQSHEYKYMLMSEQFKSASTVLENNPQPVFEYCFYDGLFPEIKIEPINVKVNGSDSSEESAENSDESNESGESKKEIAAAIKSNYTVYTKQEMTHEEFIGVGFTEFCNISAKSVANANSEHSFYGVLDGNSEEEHPSIFIYYVARKPNLFTVTPSST